MATIAGRGHLPAQIFTVFNGAGLMIAGTSMSILLKQSLVSLAAHQYTQRY